jgi:arylsulfatase A-like enzyme
MVDDLGWNHIGVEQGTMGTHGQQYVTPHLARLATEGLSFTHAYAQPNCAPTRAAMLSGQYPARIHNDQPSRKTPESILDGYQQIVGRIADFLNERGAGRQPATPAGNR